MSVFTFRRASISRFWIFLVILMLAFFVSAFAVVQEPGELPAIMFGSVNVSLLIFAAVNIFKTIGNRAGLETPDNFWGWVAQGLGAIALLAAFFAPTFGIEPALESAAIAFGPLLNALQNIVVVLLVPGAFYKATSNQSGIANGQHAVELTA